MSTCSQAVLLSLGASLAPYPSTLLNTYNYSGSIGSFTAPSSIIRVDLYGAAGGRGNGDFGQGNQTTGGRLHVILNVTAGQTVYFLVGGQGLTSGSGRDGGGGGGYSAVWIGNSSPGSGTILAMAGGGGGSSGLIGSGLDVAATNGGVSLITSGSPYGGTGGSGINGGTAGQSGSSSGGGGGGTGNGDNSGGGGGGGWGSAGGPGGAGGIGYTGGNGGFGGGGGGASGGSGGNIYRTAAGGGGGGGYGGGNGGAYAGQGGAGGSHYYLPQPVSSLIVGNPAQLVNNTQGGRAGNGYIEVYYSA